jgi:6-phosphogluconolactonase (cycloisomerase 2 family)
LDGHCHDGAGLLAPSSIVAAPGGGAVYAIASGSQGLVSFARDRSTGQLRQTGCIMARVPPAGTCHHARALAGAYALALAPGGRDLYVAARYADAVTLLRTDPAAATLRVAGCLGRPTHDRSCSPDGGLGGVRAIAVSSDGRAVVAATGDGLELFSRNAVTGLLQRAACVRARPRARTRCQVVAAVADARSMTISPDGQDVYVGTENGLAAFRIEASR